jgi:hypothetical protein
VGGGAIATGCVAVIGERVIGAADGITSPRSVGGRGGGTTETGCVIVLGLSARISIGAAGRATAGAVHVREQQRGERPRQRSARR